MALLAACVRRGLKVLSATGAGARADPTRIRVADLRESINDPLSRSVRKMAFLILKYLELLAYSFVHASLKVTLICLLYLVWQLC